MINIIMLIICLIPIVYYLLNIRKFKLDTKTMIVIALFAACGLILSKIKLIQYPQGGGIALFSMLPVMLFSLLYGKTAGVTAGLVFGLLSLLDGPYVIHPVQFLLDYIFPTMALGLAGTFGSDTRIKRIFGPLMAVVLNVFSKFLSGVVFFGAFAPENMGAVLYSLVYNGSTAGVEGVLCVVILAIMPFDRLKKHV